MSDSHPNSDQTPQPDREPEPSQAPWQPTGVPQHPQPVPQFPQGPQSAQPYGQPMAGAPTPRPQYQPYMPYPPQGPQTQQHPQAPQLGNPTDSIDRANPGKPRKHHKHRKPWTAKKTVILVIAILVVIALGIGAFFGAKALIKSHNREFAYGDYSNLPYDVDDPILNVDPDQSFSEPLRTDKDFSEVNIDGVERDALEAFDSNVTGSGIKVVGSDIAAVYADPALTTPIKAFILQEDDHLEISPYPTFGASGMEDWSKADDNGNPGKSDNIFPDGSKWALCDRYYIAVYVDENGNKRKRPKVTMFTVKDSEAPIESPATVTTTVSATGSLNIAWSPVEGATKYRVLLQKEQSAATNPDEYELSWLGETDKTTFDTASTDHAAVLAGRVYDNAQNGQFANLHVISDDDVRRNRKDVEEQDGNILGARVSDFTDADKGHAQIAVIAYKDDSTHSNVQWKDISGLLGQMPFAIAYTAWTEVRDKEGWGGFGLDSIAVTRHLPITMVDGSTVDIPVQYDPDKATTEPNAANPSATNVDLPYYAYGTRIGDEIQLIDHTGDWRTPVDQAINALYADGLPKGGMPKSFDYAKSAVDWNTFRDTPATTMPQTDLPVTGSTEYVKYVAANLLVGNRYIDVTQYSDDPMAPEVDDVVGEAVYQNPLIVRSYPSVQTRKVDGHTIIYVSYYTHDGDFDWRGEQAKMRAKAKEVASEVTHDGMSDRDKAQAINDWIVTHAQYDYESFKAVEAAGSNWGWATFDVGDRLWSSMGPEGVLVDGLGVCLSYASAFKMIADEAGLESVMMIGNIVGGSGHAWNKVKIDGDWLVVDPTWNDSTNDDPAKREKYFALKDTDPVLADHIQETDSLVDTSIQRYASK